ncbi:MAG: rhomboid family intramembrane serine protease [Chitinophagaceae bacterium]
MEDRYKKKMGLGQDGNSLMTLLSIIVIVFCLFKSIWVVYLLTEKSMASYNNTVLHWFLLPPDIDKLMTRPWTIFTYMFVHDDTLRMVGNVLWLGAFGYILQDLSGNNKLIPLFIYGALVGAVFFVLCYNVFPKLASQLPDVSPFEGCACGVMAIAIATTMLAPDYRIFPMINGGIPLWVLTVAFIIVDLVSIRGNNAAAYIAHLSGGGMGFIFVYQLRHGHDWSKWMNSFFDWIGNLFNPDKNHWKKTAKDELHYNSKGTTPYKKIPNVTQKRIDEILDKINQQGYRFLTDEEKEILKRAADDEES